MESAVCPSRLKKRNIWEADNKVTPSSVVLRLYQKRCVRCGPKFSTFTSSRMDTLVQIRSNFAYFLLVYLFFFHFSRIVLGFIKIISFKSMMYFNYIHPGSIHLLSLHLLLDSCLPQVPLLFSYPMYMFIYEFEYPQIKYVICFSLCVAFCAQYDFPYLYKYFSKQHNFILLCLNKMPVYTTHSTFDRYPGLPHNVGTPNTVSKAYLYLCHADFELFEYIHRSDIVLLCHPLVLRENTVLSSMVLRPVCLPTVPANSSLFSIVSSICFCFFNNNHLVWDNMKTLCCFNMNFPDA